jgi:hypothetical protein
MWIRIRTETTVDLKKPLKNLTKNVKANIMKSDLSLGRCGPSKFRSRPGTLLTLKGMQLRWGGGGKLLVQLLTLKGVQQLWWGRWGCGGKLLVQLLQLWWGR